ncbi:hypothetical protein CPB84DRAFT_1841816 [Gymnopilus junonius]|uniref:CCHC-type domain-containing protein n=1 Tax=Gymnopilus junonius TaxID=109634 RepID=A0A9P5P140_GYMJU|nr:hypothetical protein CPB84DRAFT_1841816 [Gymnopilus junonius]
MAFRSARIPRLTLFSGPNCSLCDTAKAALAKVRLSRPFELDTINIQDPGQDRWKRKYVYWIPALHLDGKEIAKGRWDENTVIQALKEWDQKQTQQAAPFHHFWHADGVYTRAQEDILGDDPPGVETENQPGPDQSRCFNCGDPDHKITECHYRLNRDLIALSRQYYHFFQGTLGSGNWQRVHTAEAWRQQRLNWLEEFEPGKIKGELLKDALRSSDNELLKNISVWGYPLGWLSEVDPRERVRARIWNENDGDIDAELEHAPSFEIHGEDHIETMSFQDTFQLTEHPSYASESRSNSPSATESSSTDTHSEPATINRWATYPSDYFSSQLLIPYRPPSPPSPWFRFEDTSAYLAYHAPRSFAHISTPPPPSEEPPPLPPLMLLPPPPSTTLPPLPTNYTPISSQRTSQRVDLDGADLSECDMDLSDSE